MVLKVREMYAAGHTIAEIQSQVSGAKVQNLMVRYGIERRSSAKRNQRGERNHMWRGSNAGYQALHLRVEAERGKPSCCVTCGTDDPDIRYEWANLTGNYADTSDFERMCVACHRVFDAARRAETGERTSPVRR
ncbi:MAG: hypothetical protein LLG14_20350 [Nocardiaceae bacterium]|nr:hypothetical protein [Nocardiaceae bacterium]